MIHGMEAESARFAAQPPRRSDWNNIIPNAISLISVKSRSLLLPPVFLEAKFSDKV